MARPLEYGEPTVRIDLVLPVSYRVFLEKQKNLYGTSISKIISAIIEYYMISDDDQKKIEQIIKKYQGPSFEEIVKVKYKEVEEEVIRILQIRINKNRGAPNFYDFATVVAEDIYPLLKKKYSQKAIAKVVEPLIKETWNNLYNANFGRHSAVEKKQKSPFPSEFSTSSASSQNTNINEVSKE